MEALQELFIHESYPHVGEGAACPVILPKASDMKRELWGSVRATAVLLMLKKEVELCKLQVGYWTPCGGEDQPRSAPLLPAGKHRRQGWILTGQETVV